MNKKLVKEIAGGFGVSANKNVSSIMTKIYEVTILDISDNREKLKEKIKRSKKTFYPVCEGCRENIIGIIHVKEILIDALSDSEIDLKEGIHEPVYFSGSSTIQQVYDIFFQSNIGAAFIIDKINNIIGFITMKDIVKNLIENFLYKVD